MVVPGPSQAVLGIGIVGDDRIHDAAPVIGSLALEVKQTGAGVRVTKFQPGSYARDALETGDVITQVEGTEVRTHDDYVSLAETVERIAGDRLTVSYLRNGKPRQASVSLSPKRDGGEWERREFSDRRSGFPSIFVHDVVLAPNQCGGALVDSRGNVIGINIARRDRHETLAVPATTVFNELQKLRQDIKAAVPDGR